MYSSLDSLGTLSGGRYPVPHFDAKAAVAARLEHGLPRDFDALRRLHSGLTTFAAWLQRSGWRGEPEDFMKSARESGRR